MANDSKIVITAGLQIPETVSTVEKELKVVGEKISADRALKITGNLDLPKTTQRIQSQLATINKDLKLDINTVNVDSNINAVVSNVQKGLSTIGNTVDIKFNANDKVLDNVENALKNIGVKSDDVKKLTEYFEELDVVVTKIKPKFVDLAGTDTGKVLDSLSVFGVDKKTGNIVNIAAQMDNVGNKVAKTTYTITQNLASVEKESKKVEDSAKAAQLAYNDFLKLKGQADLYSKKFSGDDNLKTQLADIQKLVAEFDNTQPVEKQRESIIRIDNALKIVKADIDAISKAASQTNTNVDRIYPNLSFNKSDSSTAILTDAKNQLNTFFNAESIDSTASRVKRAVEDASGSLQRFYVQIERGDKSVETLTYALNEQGNAYEYLGKVVREADNSTNFRHEGLDTQIEIQTQKVEQFAETVGKSQEATAILGNDIAKLREDISKVGDTNAMNAFLDNFDIAKAKFGAISAQLQNTKRDYDSVNKSINDNIKSLEKFNNSTVAKNNASNPTVASQTGLNADLINQLRGLQESLANDKSPENITRITARMNELGGSLRDAKFNSEALDQSLRDESSAAKLSANISNLTNQVEIFANTNKKATESLRQMRSGVTFADEWQRITSALKNGNLDDNAIRRLTEDFRNFKGEARSVGVTTSSFFNNMGNQLKMLVSRWVSLYAVIGKIRTMINYVIQLDDAMTKLKRVTDETAAGYEQFLEVAKKSAKETNTTLVDTVEQAAKWAKSGYDAATSAELAKTSLIYSIVGDIDNDTAVSDLVTALRGFRLEAEDAISVVDKLDALNNKYATDAKSLGEGLRVSASAMAAANNDIDQTLALLTGATEITQNAQETGQAIKTITMRLRGMKGELQELGEDAEGVESISKIQTQILNLTKGRVNIFDANGNFRATYDILKDISEVYNELSDPDKANLTEIIFGKLRSNQGLAIISAFQSGQIQKALKDSQNSAGTATEEMVRYSESITAHISKFKEAVQELSSDAIDADVVNNVVDQGKELVNLLDHLITSIEKLKEVANFNGLIELYDKIRESPIYNILNPLKGFLDWVNQGNDIYADLFGEKDDITQGMAELSDNINSASLSYIQYYSAGRNADDISVKLATTIDGINEKYADNKEKIDLTNKSMAENLSLMRQIERQELGDWLSKNADEYGKAVDELNKVGYTNINFLRKDWLDGLELPNLNIGTTIQEITGTDQERLDSLTKIKDAISGLNDVRQRDLDQLDAEIKKLESSIEKNKAFVDSLEAIREKYNSLSGASAQSYNMIEQAAVAYQQYQESVASGDREGTKNAFAALNNIKSILYSMTDTNSVLRQDFNDLWATFVFGATEGMSKVEEVRADFAELSGEAFDNELKNIESISKAIDSMLNDETLSHEDAWKLLNLDTEGVLSDIQLINGQYKLSTDQLVALMEQQINKQKESIETVKAAAQAEYDLLQAQLRRLKVNSPSDVAAYKLEVERITDEMRDMQDVISGSDLLLQEVNGILGKTYSITGSIATGLSNAVKQFEAEVDAIDDAIDSLNDRKEVLQDEKSILQDQLDALNEQKKTIEDTLATYDRVGEAVDELVKAQVDGIQAQIDALEEERKSIEDYYEEQLDALKEQNEERDDAIEKEEALANLANAQNQKKRVYSSDRGWDYEASKADILKAQNELAKIANNEQIKMLENERDAKLAGYDDRKKEYETQIKEYEDYASKYTSISNDIKIAESELLAAQILGSDWREKIEQKDEGLLTNYRAQYTSFNEQLNNLTNNEIATLQASIDAKDEEIKKIDDEIAAYNKYKKSVEKSLNDAKTALENYKNSMNDAKTEIINALDGVERETQDKNSKIISHNEAMAKSAEDAKDRMNHAYWEIGNSARELANTLQEHLLHGDIDLAQYVRMMHLDGYADGGVNTSTGIAMLHGTKQKGEVIFNASDSKKLYDMIHGTPNLLADVAKQANKIAGFSPVNNNNSTNSVSVSIGQIVANNPQEFTRGLDRELDQYFRRKLTESYVQ